MGKRWITSEIHGNNSLICRGRGTLQYCRNDLKGVDSEKSRISRKTLKEIDLSGNGSLKNGYLNGIWER